MARTLFIVWTLPTLTLLGCETSNETDSCLTFSQPYTQNSEVQTYDWEFSSAAGEQSEETVLAHSDAPGGVYFYWTVPEDAIYQVDSGRTDYEYFSTLTRTE